MNIDDLLAKVKQREQVVPVLADPSLLEDRAAIEQELREARAYDRLHNEKDTAPAVEKKLAKMDEKIESETIWFRFRGLPRREYLTLLTTFPPREGNLMDRRTGFDSDEFPPHLLAACAVDPELSVEQARTIWEEWSDAMTTELVNAAVAVNREVVDVPFTRPASKRTTPKESSGSTQPTTESPTPSS